MDVMNSSTSNNAGNNKCAIIRECDGGKSQSIIDGTDIVQKDKRVINEAIDVNNIPSVVQRALGMQNIKYHQVEGSSSSSDGVICGLEGFSLPRYLSLRSGQHVDDAVRQNKATSLPEALMKAQEEALHHRRCHDRKQTSCGGRSGKNASRPRKRKRKSHHRCQELSFCNSESKTGTIPNNTSDAVVDGSKGVPDKNQDIDGCNTQHHGKRRNRKRRKRSPGNNVDTANAETLSNNSSSSSSSGDWIHYQMMARIIIAPYTSSLITTMNRCKQVEKQQKLRTQSMLANNEDHNIIATPAALQIAAPARSPSIALKPSLSSTRNIYQKSSTISNPQIHNNFLILSSPQESLETIVDGAVCTLVRRTHRFRCQSSPTLMNKRRNGQGGSTSSGNKGGKQTMIYRRRPRRKESNQQKMRASEIVLKSNRESFAAAATATPLPSIKRNASLSVNNNWLLEQNLLSTGYALGYGDTLTTSSSRTNNNNSHKHKKLHHNNQVLRGCPNMAPGIHCIHPNTLTSYARSSALMRFLHSVIGDDALREILVNAVVLVPAISTESPKAVSLFDRGNYFQLCGPPINMLAKKFDGMSNALAAMNTHELKRRKRKRDVMEDDESSAMGCTTGGLKSNSSTANKSTAEDNSSVRNATEAKERWDPNKIIPRGSLFYCDFYNKHVGLSPRHLLNQREEGSSEGSQIKVSTNSNVNVKLLNDMVQIWPRSRNLSKERSGNGVIGNCNKRRGRWRRLRERGVAMCKEMRRRHRQCDYARLLEHHCPLAIKETNGPSYVGFKEMDTKAALCHHVTLHTSAENVGSFLEAVLRSAFPTSFWGSIHNFCQVVQTVKVFTKLGRTEQIPEKALVDGIRVLDMTWLLPHHRVPAQHRRQSAKFSRSDHESATTLLRNAMRWLYCKFIIPLLRSTFYITETEFTGSRVLYYRRPIWIRIKYLSMKLLLKNQYRELSAAKAQKILSLHNVGCPPAPLRLLPKKTGIRAIAMLSKSCAMEDIVGSDSSSKKEEIKPNGTAALCMKPESNSAPPNKILQSTFHALKYEHEKKPSLFGAGVLGLTEAFPSFCLFAEALKQNQSNLRSSPASTGSGSDDSQNSLYFASVDIKHCYDTINQKRLFKLMRSVIEEDVYLTKNNFILHSKDNSSSLRCRWKKSTFSPDQFSRFLANSNAFAEKYFHSILVDGIHCSMEKKETITGLLRDHIFGQVVVANGNYGPRYLLQKDGIPQVRVVFR